MEVSDWNKLADRINSGEVVDRWRVQPNILSPVKIPVTLQDTFGSVEEKPTQKNISKRIDGLEKTIIRLMELRRILNEKLAFVSFPEGEFSGDVATHPATEENESNLCKILRTLERDLNEEIRKLETIVVRIDL